MDKNFYDNLEINFEQAFAMSEKFFSHEELIKLMQTGNIPQKQIAAIKFDFIKTEEDAKVLLDNLTGCDGKIREAVAFTLKRLLSESSDVKNILADISAETFANATIDINANICRSIVDSAALLKEYDNFSKTYTSYILKYIEEAFTELDKFIFRDKKYVINKQIFKLYWCLETLCNFWNKISPNTLEKILDKASMQKEYTIREKAAQIVNLSGKFESIAESLKNDSNYYVRAVFTQ